MKWSVHPSGILWLSVLFYLEPALVLPFLLAAGLHELGHALALRAMGRPPLSVTLSFSGAKMEVGSLSYRQELWAAAAGPGMSLLVALLWPVLPALGLYSLLLGCFNLLPIPGLDGGRILRCALLLRCREETALRISRYLGIVTALGLWGWAVYLSQAAGLGLWPLLVAALGLYKALV